MSYDTANASKLIGIVYNAIYFHNFVEHCETIALDTMTRNEKISLNWWNKIHI